MPLALIFDSGASFYGVIQTENQRPRGNKGRQEESEEDSTGLEARPARTIQQAVERAERWIVCQPEYPESGSHRPFTRR